jgi:protein associated with RNAse G/E
MTPPQGSPTNLTVYKLDHEGREVWHYPARVLARHDHSVRLEAFFNRDDMDLGYTVFKRGDRFIETFYNDRWYNIFAIYDRDDGHLKGWYCNIARPAMLGPTSIHCEDLALDIWVEPNGNITILDEDEFAELPLAPSEQRQAESGLQTLLDLACNGLLPR